MKTILHRFMRDVALIPDKMSQPPIITTRRCINFGNVPMDRGPKIAFEEFTLTNNTERDLTLIWEICKNRISISECSIATNYWRLNREPSRD